MKYSSVAVLALTASFAVARDVPANVRTFYNKVKTGTCDSLKGGFYSEEGGPKNFSYCNFDLKGISSSKVVDDSVDDTCEGDAEPKLRSRSTSGIASVMYLHGASKGGEFPNMDIDCDGDQSGGDGRCGSSTDTQSQTSFMDTVASYGAKRDGKKVKDLDANIHPYVVFGNDGSKNGYISFDPSSKGIEPLSLMAVVCGDKLIYGVWGDTNGDDGPPLVGEASLSLATACFGDVVNGNAGHDGNDVLYVAFPGKAAVPGKAANWGATNYEDFEQSIADLGDSLIKNL